MDGTIRRNEHFRWRSTTLANDCTVKAISVWHVYESTEFHLGNPGFDADRVIDAATYDDPGQYPVGIPYVLVNGVIAVDAERCTGSMSGQALRRS